MANTRQSNIEHAFVFFLQKGYKAVRLSDIEKAAGITRGTFYYHFTNKAEVLKEGLIEYYALIDACRMQEFERITSLREYIDLAVAKLEEIHNYKARAFGSDIPEVLCLSLLVEVITIFPELKKVTGDSKMLRLAKLEQLIIDAKQTGELRQDVDTSVLARNILNIMAGVINYLVMRQDVSYAISSMRAQYEQLYSLVVVK